MDIAFLFPVKTCVKYFFDAVTTKVREYEKKAYRVRKQ